MTTKRRLSIFFNPYLQRDSTLAKAEDTARVQTFHRQLPGYTPTPLISLNQVAQETGVKAVFIKDEGARLGLPSFKVLGASWATHQAIASLLGLPRDAPLDVVGRAAREHDLKLFAATDGNHGRAVARMAKTMGIAAFIYIPADVAPAVARFIESEGAHVTVGKLSYDDTVREAHAASKRIPGAVFVQDGSFEDYEEIPRWTVEGYSTMLVEIEEQLHEQGFAADMMITPVGVGSLAHAVVSHCRSKSCSVVAVEPEVAACLQESLRSGKLESIPTSGTIMEGLNCGTPSMTAFEDLKAHVTAALTVSDSESHEAVERLGRMGIACGPCGGAALAGFMRLADAKPRPDFLSADSVVVLLSTEGPREYETPTDGDAGTEPWLRKS